MDLFENVNALPKKVRRIITDMENELNSTGNNHYAILQSYLKKLRPYEYSFQYGLDAVPYDLANHIQIGDVVLDDVVNDDNGQWTQLCTEHAEELHEEGFLDNIGEGICGVKGCQKESLYYLDLRK